MGITYTTYEQMHDVIVEKLLPQIPMDVTKVVGIPRSGLVAAAMVSFDRHIHLGALDTGNIAGGDRVNHGMAVDDGAVLLIDDAVSRGIRMREGAQRLRDNGRRVIRASVFIQRGSEHLVDIFGAYLKHPRLFEWNLFNHGLGPRIIFDMDGVFCRDPDVFDDDGPAYAAALENAVPLRLSRWPVGTICTNRIERWRGITEAWLKRHRVVYNRLLMNPAKTAQERRGNPLKHKVECYGSSNAVLFVESSQSQAQQIAGQTGKPVLSLEDKRIYS